MANRKDPSRFRQKTRQTTGELDYRQKMERYIASGAGTFIEKLENFPKYASRQSIGRYLALYEAFKLALPVQGIVAECGVNWGGGLMAFAQFSAVLEPVNLQRTVVGFDTFAGFPGLNARDRRAAEKSSEARKGGFAADSEQDLRYAIELFDRNRFLGHVGKVELVRGDAAKTIPAFLRSNPQTVVSLLHLDFDIYAPTKAALKHFLPRMPKGGVIVFDELNNKTWPGETVAVMELLRLNDLAIRRFPFEPHLSYAIVGETVRRRTLGRKAR